MHDVLSGRFALVTFLLLIPISLSITDDAKTVDKWAERIGSDLLELASAVARPNDIKSGYEKLNARVEDKSGKEMIDIIGTSVGRMLRKKMDAVQRILERAEKASVLFNDSSISNWTKITKESAMAQDLPYVSGRYSPIVGRPPPVLPKPLVNTSFMYREMELTPDSHFYNIPVNTNFSSVHVPTNVYDLAREVNQAIQWSKELDDVFIKNYRADPALSWQYFGSTTGILRQYPAMEWHVGGPGPDQYDCRMRSWYIESATCSKHMVILLDISGSMQGSSYAIAKATASEILDTLSNNDFVTIIGFTNITIDVVSCFNDTIVQATPENIAKFKNDMEKMPISENGNVVKALNKAFDILEHFRESSYCSSETPCTQAIMLVTDGVPANLTEVFETRNRLKNGTRIPVRVFTYLLGRDVTKVREIQLMACMNRGYYSHVHTLSEVREQVLKYIPVIARPLVLQEVEHPMIWTHAYADISAAELEDDDEENNPSVPKKTAYQKFKLLTSVSVPAYDRKINSLNDSRTAELLGVAGTDVSLDEINKLTLPYKLGVNGYAFIVSNNGYVILHPALRPDSAGKLKVNYNSMDLTEIEIIDDGDIPRNPGKTALELRRKLVNHESGNITKILVHFHYDDYRRVTIEERNYFFAPLEGTPFGLAIALPKYGTKWIEVGDAVKKNKIKNVKIVDFFSGNRWRVHPTWVYCRFHYEKGHTFDKPEDEVKHFLKALNDDAWEWYEQYEEPPNKTSQGQPNMNNTDENGEKDEMMMNIMNKGTPAFSQKLLDDEAYYCNKELMQLLVFDGELTSRNFTEKFEYPSAEEKALGEAYGVYLRFIATQSGLTRWQDVGNPPADIPEVKPPPSDYEYEDEVVKPKLEFGDLHARAVNEPWYKGAIFQHGEEPESIHLTVPSVAGPNAIVTVAQGIFPIDGGREAPAAVVGFQMPMMSFYQRFLSVTANSTESDLSCTDDFIDCYLLDQNGYVVISNSHNATGKFFGVVEGAIMVSLVKQNVYKGVNLYDYQALCSTKGIKKASAASFLKTPLEHLTQIFTWLFVRLMWFTSQIIELPETLGRKSASEDAPDPPPPPEEETIYFACDQMRTLYILQRKNIQSRIENIPDIGSRPFSAAEVPHTNLLLVVVDITYSSSWGRLEVDPKEMPPSSYPTGSEGWPCHKLPLNNLPRRALPGCYTEHPLEHEIEDCGAGSAALRSTLALIGFTVLLAYS